MERTNRLSKAIRFCFFGLALAAIFSIFQPTPDARSVSPKPRVATDFGYQFFDVNVIVNKEGLISLERYPREWVDCIFQVGNQEPTHGELHLKGTGSFQPISKTPNFTVKPRKDDSSPNVSLFTRKFHLNNSVQDPSMLRDMMARTIYQRAGVPTPNLAYSHVRLNGRVLGFYTVSEGVGKHFVEQSFGIKDARLYEGEVEDVDTLLVRHIGAARSGLAHMLVVSQNETFLANLFDSANLRAFIIAEHLCAHEDGLLFNLNNYHIIDPDSNSALLLFPHTADAAFRNETECVAPRIQSRMIIQAVKNEQERQKMLQELDELSSAENFRFFVTKLHAYGSNLINDIAVRNPKSAIVHCAAYRHLAHKVQLQFEAVRNALDIELRDQGDFIGTIREATQWRFDNNRPNGFNVASMGGRQLVMLRSSSLSRETFAECAVVLRPGTYVVRLCLRLFGADFAHSKRASVSLGALEFGSSTWDVKNDWKCFEHRFNVGHSREALFSLKKTFILLRSSDLLGEIHMDVARSSLTRVNE